MKIIAIGDPHGDLESIKKIPLKGINLILLTGDLGSANLMRQMAFKNVERRKKDLPEIRYSSAQEKRAYMEAYSSSLRVVKYLSSFAPVLTIYGNVEASRATVNRKSRKIGVTLPHITDGLAKIKNVRIINNKKIMVAGISIGGLEYFIDTNWVNDFKPSDYEKRMKFAIKGRAKANQALESFGRVDILLHHQPPYGFLDKVGSMAPRHWQGKNAGSTLILDYIRRAQPKYAFCGHIHECAGNIKIGKTEVYNLGVCGYKIKDITLIRKLKRKM